MKNIILILAITLGLVSCQKETFEPTDNEPTLTTEQETLDIVKPSEFVEISFNDVFDSGTDSVLIFRDDVFVKTFAIGCGNKFKASLNHKYSFKKRYKNRTIPLYGNETSIDTYVTFLTTNSKPEYCIDYIKEGLGIIFLVTNPDDRCENAHYTFNAWF